MKSGFLSKKIVPSVFLSIISVAIIDSFYSAPANAGWLTGGLAVTTAGGAVGAGIVGTPVAGAAVYVVGATAEIGVSYMCGLLGFGDPPDLINYAVKADPLLIIPSFSTDPTASTELNQAAIGVITAVSVVVQNAKGISQSRDRLAGAKLVGTPTDVANQTLWLSEFENQVSPSLKGVGSALDIYIPLLKAEFPNFYNLEISASDVIAIRDMEAAGIFLPTEQQLINDWELDSFAVDVIANYFANLTDAQINNLTPITYGEGLVIVSDTCGTGNCRIPEPTSTLSLLSLGILGAGATIKRKVKRSNSLEKEPTNFG